MTDLSGRWYIDGIDIFTTFGVFIEEGSADFLKYPPKKDGIEHDWKDANGREVDLSRFFFDQREGVLNMAIICTNATDFWTKHDQFISQMIQPALRRLSLASHGDRSYYVYYKECNNYSAIKPLTGDDAGLFAHRFSMVVVEPEPQVDASHQYLVDEEGHFIIT
jgi:hypothetical protein